MPGEAVAEFFLRPIFELLIQLLGYYTSRIILPIISLGHIFVAPAKKGIKVYPKWHGFDRSSDGKIILHEEMGALIGIIIWFVILGLGFYAFS